MILAADFYSLHFACHMLVDGGEGEYRSVLFDSYLKDFIRQHILLRTGQLFYDPFSVADILKQEFPIGPGNRCHNRIFFDEFFFIFTEQPKHSTLNGFSVFVHFQAFDIASDVFVFHRELNNRAVLGNGYLIQLFVWYESRCRAKFFDNPFAITNLLKAEGPVFIGFRCHKGGIFCKFFCAVFEQSKESAGNNLAVFVNLVTENIAADIAVLQGDFNNLFML